MTIVFLILAVLAIVGASAAMAFRSAVHAVLALALAFVSLAAIYLNLDAQFVGFTQVIVYVGAVAILAVFAIMMTRSDTAHHHQPVFSKTWLTGVVLAGGVFTVLAWAVLGSQTSQASTASPVPVIPPPVITVTQIGESLMQRYAMPLEIMGLLLTAALIGAVVLAMPMSSEKAQAKGDAQ